MVRRDEEVADLSREFVCVRIVNMAGVDLELFDFDYDLTLAILFMDGNDIVYSRFGGRDAGPADSRLSKESLLHAMRRVLEIHATEWAGPDDRDTLPPARDTVERIPPMAERIRSGNAPQCFHCHMVAHSRREDLVNRGQFRKDEIWDYPLPENLGVTLDRDHGAVVATVERNTPAARARLQEGDEILTVDGRRVVTEMDVRDALHRFDGRRLEIEYRRGDETDTTRLSLSEQWRRSDISWRESMFAIPPNPGYWAPECDDTQRRQAGIAADRLALRVQWVPTDGAAYASGLRQGMIIVAVDGSRERMTPGQVQLYIRVNKNPGDSVRFTVLENGRERDIDIRLR